MIVSYLRVGNVDQLGAAMIIGGLSVRPTRHKELGYAQIDSTTWMFVDMETGRQIGPHYPTKTECLGDLERFYTERFTYPVDETKRFEAAIQSLQDFIAEINRHPTTVHVYVDQRIGGLRVDQVHCQTGEGSGYTYFRSEAPEVILAAEDFLATFGIAPPRPEGWESDLDEHQDAQSQLRYALTR
jgi:hypothetical protein